MNPRRVTPRQRVLPDYAPRYETHPNTNSRSFALYDFMVDIDPFEWHYHPELEFILYVSASGIRMVGDSIENYDRGDLCLIGSNVPHTWSIHAKPGKLERNIQVQFMPDFFGEQFLNLPEMQILKRLFARAQHGLKIVGPTRRVISEKFLALADTRPNASDRFCRILSLLVEVAQSKDIRPLSSALSLPSGNPHINKVISQILEFVRTHIETDASQSEAAELVGMTPAAFSRFFKRHFGKTYSGFINEVRIGRVCSSLLETDLTMTEAAYASGFKNLSHFNEQFRIYKKMTPSAYRRWIRSQFPAHS